MDYRSGDELAGEEASGTGNTRDYETEDGDGTEEEGAEASDYVLNHNTMKFHLPGCGSVKTIREANREDVRESREVLIRQGFEPCKNCNP